MKLLNGLELAGYIKERQAKQVRALRQAWGVFPKLAIVTDVNNPVIDLYMRLKKQYGADILISVDIYQVTSDKVLSLIQELNNRDDTQAIIVQLPLSNTNRTDEVLAAVDPAKDVDGLHPNSKYDAATPIAIQWLLAGYGIEMTGKKVAIVGRGRLVGAPLEKILNNSGVSTEVFEKDDGLTKLKQYDIIITATGQPHIITTGLLKEGAVVVDAGTASEDGRIVGDVDPSVRERQDITITPERGGVGPLTVAALFDNVITACQRIAQEKRQD